MSNQRIINTIKVVYYDQNFTVIPKHTYLDYNKRISMLEYLREIGDVAFIVDGELYIDDGAYFNLSMKYCEEFVFI